MARRRTPTPIRLIGGEVGAVWRPVSESSRRWLWRRRKKKPSTSGGVWHRAGVGKQAVLMGCARTCGPAGEKKVGSGPREQC
jgi:hypothetical protein